MGCLPVHAILKGRGMPHAILKGRGMPLNPRCPRCNREIETIHHAKIACGGTEHILIAALRMTTLPVRGLLLKYSSPSSIISTRNGSRFLVP